MPAVVTHKQCTLLWSTLTHWLCWPCKDINIGQKLQLWNLWQTFTALNNLHSEIMQDQRDRQQFGGLIEPNSVLFNHFYCLRCEFDLSLPSSTSEDASDNCMYGNLCKKGGRYCNNFRKEIKFLKLLDWFLLVTLHYMLQAICPPSFAIIYDNLIYNRTNNTTQSNPYYPNCDKGNESHFDHLCWIIFSPPSLFHLLY